MSIVFEGKGIIKNINSDEKSLTLQHEAIPALSWPEMTMDFSVNQDVELNQFKVGDVVRFKFNKDKNNSYQITGISKAVN
jgi:Cu/Ag efflux protein CusF